jgi:hypothetical protein
MFGILLLTESANEIHSDLLRNPHVGQVRVDLPDAEERAQFLRTELDFSLSDLDETQLAARTSGLSLLRVRQLLAEATRNGKRITHEHVTSSKKRLIEEFCQGLVRFKDPKQGISLDLVATHTAAKKEAPRTRVAHPRGKDRCRRTRHPGPRPGWCGQIIPH